MIKCDRSKIWFVEWHDAHTHSGWHSDQDVEAFIKEEKCIIQEVGWIVAENKDEIVMSSSRAKFSESQDVSEWGTLQKIPKAWIKKKACYTLTKEEQKR